MQAMARHLVGVDVVRELYGVMDARGAVGGYIVTSANFTPDAKEFAFGRNISLVDGEKLIQEMKRRSPAIGSAALAAPTSLPKYPACSSPMVGRVANRGENLGQSFWGCSHFPACNGTRDR